MRFKEFSEAVDIEQDPAVKFYRMLTNPFGSNDSTKNSNDNPAGGTPSSARNASISGNYPAFREPGFKEALEKSAANLGIDPNHLIAIMKQESKLDPQAVNKTSKATGLIQFMPDTAAKLGTSTSAIYNMSATEQMPLVEKYLKGAGVRPGMGLGDLYIAVFYPAALGKSDNHVLGAAGAKGFSGRVYSQNKGLDTNKDGVITVADVKNSISKYT